MAKNMTARKKTRGRATTVRKTATSQFSKTGKTDKPVQAATDEQAAATIQASSDENTAKTVKSSADEKTAKAVKTSARETTRREPAKQENKTSRRDAKGSNTLTKRLRSNKIGNFLYEAFYELRYKVTWPTFREARNMTMVVLALSAVIGILLAGADFGLHRLFLFIIGAQ